MVLELPLNAGQLARLVRSPSTILLQVRLYALDDLKWCWAALPIMDSEHIISKAAQGTCDKPFRKLPHEA